MNILKKEMNQAFFEIFGSMLNSGVPLVKALQAFEADCVDEEYRQVVARMREEVVAGKNIAECLDEFELCESVMAILTAGVRNGEFDYACLKVGKVIEAQQKMKFAYARYGAC